MPVKARSYTSPTLVLLAYDWPGGDGKPDFLGFAIKRTPGFDGAASSWLPNRISFGGPKPDQSDYSSDEAPIQKFYWWDARIDTKDRGSTFTYEIVPVLGPPDNLQKAAAEKATIKVTVPLVTEKGITSHFNRAVVSSQAFSKQFPTLNTPSQLKAAAAWLANGMEQAVPDFLGAAQGKDIEGAIYHLTDATWIIPAMQHYAGSVSLTYNHTSKDDASDAAIQQLVDAGRPASAFAQRTHASIMHNKFLVRVGHADHAEAVLAGSANFTTEGLSVQANVLHVYESPDLAALYLARKRLLDGDPSLHSTQVAQQGWSNPIQMEDATLRVFFPPEGKTTRASLDTIVDAVSRAQSSVLLCAFDPTDGPLLKAVFDASDRGLMMLGLVNKVAAKAPSGDPGRADVAAEIAIMDRASKDGSMAGFSAFDAKDTPTDFAPERVLWPKEDPKIMVRVHHKFVVIDGETDSPTIFTGSANFSGNSLHNNDENLIEITRSPRLGQMYMAEFLRLYEHYRARASFQRREGGDASTFALSKDATWAAKYFKAGSPENKARVAMSS